MSSIPPPLPCPPAPPASRIHGSAILTSASMAFALVAGVFAWIATHPHPAAPRSQPINVVPIAAAIEPNAELPAPPPIPRITETPAFQRPHPRDEIVNNIPSLEEAPPFPQPSSPPAKPKPEAGLVQAPPQAAGETYGTQVTFHNNQSVAAELAGSEHKLLFVMHISGNFEDACFT